PVLRQLFLDELPTACRNVVNAARSGDLPALHAGLHRLQASCGFVGAARLAAAIAELRASPASTAALEHFRNAVEALLPPGCAPKT
ncbi:MAG: Hpt domain-containing protein, partial [Xanthomonadaceae bacterium]|nr:Hpt domain-containing protein [Xanthomonadaceae bacterium]